MSDESDKPVVAEVCGLVMPISAIDGCDEKHWSDVRKVLEQAIGQTKFRANLVSEATDAGIIHERIIRNLYENPIVVCDVSGKNPNVMFELGLRLAFNKPVIVVKDDKTAYSFDTAPIEHITYPRDLNFHLIVEFKERLAGKIDATHQRATAKDGTYVPFLSHFGILKAAEIGSEVVPRDIMLLLKEIGELKVMLQRRMVARTAQPEFVTIQHIGRKWLNTSYDTSIYRVEGTNWVEQDNKTKEVRFNLIEIDTGPHFVELFNIERTQIWRIGDQRMELREGEKLSWLANGHWVAD
jgi:hypothetical protein